jgi:hypothetical protein
MGGWVGGWVVVSGWFDVDLLREKGSGRLTGRQTGRPTHRHPHLTYPTPTNPLFPHPSIPQHNKQVAYGSKDEVKRFEEMVGIKFATAHPDVAAKAHA